MIAKLLRLIQDSYKLVRLFRRKYKFQLATTLLLYGGLKGIWDSKAKRDKESALVEVHMTRNSEYFNTLGATLFLCIQYQTEKHHLHSVSVVYMPAFMVTHECIKSSCCVFNFKMKNNIKASLAQCFCSVCRPLWSHMNVSTKSLAYSSALSFIPAFEKKAFHLE